MRVGRDAAALAVLVLGCALLVSILHRNSGDVGAAADLAAARDVVASRTAPGENPFEPVSRGTFRATVQWDRDALGDNPPEDLLAVELGAFSSSGRPALRLRLDPLGARTASHPMVVTLRQQSNGVTVRWPAESETRAIVADLRSASTYDEPVVELHESTVVVPLPEVFDPAAAWTVNAHDMRE